MDWVKSLFGIKPKTNVLPTTNTRRINAAPANAAVVPVARPEQQPVLSRAPSVNSRNAATANTVRNGATNAVNRAGASSPVMPNSNPKNATVLNVSGQALVGGKRKSKSKSKSKKSKKSKSRRN